MNCKTILTTLLLCSFSPFLLADKDHVKSDGEIIAWLITLNNHEIKAAQEANKKHPLPAVKKYADFMIKEHTLNLKQTKALSKEIKIAPVKGKSVEKLEKQSDKGLKKLHEFSDKEFQKEYIKAMIKDHDEALDIIKDTHLDHVDNAKLKDHLEVTSKHVKNHLELAKDIKDKMD